MSPSTVGRASRWLIANGYDELMGARPMARVIQEHIKKPLADKCCSATEIRRHVRVIVDKDEEGRDKLGFEYLTGRSRRSRKAAGGAAKAAALAALETERRRKKGSVPKYRWPRSDSA